MCNLSYALNIHMQLSSGTRSQYFCLNLHLNPYFGCMTSEGSGETVRMQNLV